MSGSNVQLRTDVFTGRQVLVAEDRANRPNQRRREQMTYRPEDDPFLAGHEHDTPRERLALRTEGSNVDDANWLVRAIPNRYPAVASESDHDNSAGGVHDVVVECPDSRCLLTELSVVEFARVLRAWQLRFSTLSRNPNVKCVTIFRNEGTAAGASIAHCHSQIIATEFLTSQVQRRVERVQKAAARGHDLYNDWLNSELSPRTRVVDLSEGLVTICPFAGRVSWQTRFCPFESGDHDFRELNENQLLRLSASVQGIAAALTELLGGVQHNLLLTLPPTNEPTLFPWMLDLMPRTGSIAGFELQADMDIVTVSPESAAERLRNSVEFQDATAAEQICPPGYSWVE